VKRPLLGTAAIATAGTLVWLSIAPALATHTVSHADATAIRLSVAGEGSDSGTVTATNDGSGEVKTGETSPAVGILGDQQLLNLGVLTQDAAARIVGQDGVSDACAGVAGEGAAVVAVGDSSCISRGEPVGVKIANLDLTGTSIIQADSALGEALADLDPATRELVEPLVGDITAAVTDALAPLADLGVGGTLGAVEAVCHAEPGTATGSANIVDTTLSLTLPDQDPIIIAKLPVHPAPNTKVVTDLDEVINGLLTAVQTDLEASLGGELDPLGSAIDPLKEQVVTAVIGELANSLAPLEDLLDITLNKQSSTGPGHISVTALDLRVLKAAAEQLDAPLVSAEIANVNCGPNSRIHTVQRESSGQESSGKANNPEVPTVVNSGLEGGAAASGDQGADSALVAGGLLALAGAAGALGYRRFAAR